MMPIAAPSSNGTRGAAGAEGVLGRFVGDCSIRSVISARSCFCALEVVRAVPHSIQA